MCGGVNGLLIKYGEESPAALIIGEGALKKGELQHQGGNGGAIGDTR